MWPEGGRHRNRPEHPCPNGAGAGSMSEGCLGVQPEEQGLQAWCPLLCLRGQAWPGHLSSEDTL